MKPKKKRKSFFSKPQEETKREISLRSKMIPLNHTNRYVFHSDLSLKSNLGSEKDLKIKLEREEKKIQIFGLNQLLKKNCEEKSNLS